MPNKLAGSDEQIIQWAVVHRTPAHAASGDRIKAHWTCGSERAKRLASNAQMRMADLEPAQRDGSHLEIRRAGDNALRADVVFHTPAGQEPTLAEALENPKLKQALASAEINLADFEVVKFRSNSWDVTMKLRTADGADQPELRTNHQFSIEWHRRKPTPLLTALEHIEERLSIKDRPVAKAPVRSGKRMVEVALYDLHFGLLAWAPETGEDYDVTIARKVMADATAQIVQRTYALDVEYFLFPIGNDFLHVNNVMGQTPQNKNQLDVDTRLARIIEEGELALRDTIDELKEIAPVHLFWVPGNHDPQTSYYLLRILNAWYRLDDRVQIDVSPKPRKIHLYGINLIGFMHGCDIASSREKALAGILADEAAAEWAPGQYREIHKGHYHGKGELYFAGVSTYGGVVVRTIPSLSGTDYWTFSKGFVGGSKTAQFFVWNKEHGLESVQDVHVSRDLYAHAPETGGGLL